MTPLLGLSADAVGHLEYIAAGLVLLVLFVLAARLVAQFIAARLHRKQMRSDLVVLLQRVVYVIVIGLGVFGALGLAFETANVALFGVLIATVVAALGLQQLLQDYVSGYYVLFERHFRVGDRIGFDDKTGTVVEVRLRVTLLKGENGDLVVVPNSELFNKPVTVYTKKVEEPVATTTSAPPG